ncbi:MAG TPA: AAA family ATPase [Solirubrobacteraceae bacterium]|nr:AAA family ATPase [Solirubrobacteraceae bacterium]
MRKPNPDMTGLLERDAALHAIGAALEAAARGSGAALFLLGGAGIGKTSLVERCARAARDAGFTVGAAVGSPMEAELPFGLLGQAIVALGGSDVEDVVQLERLGGQPARFYRTFRWLSELAAETPLLLALDDLHWADRDSLALLGFISRRLGGSRIFVLGALRPQPDPANELAGELAGSGHADVMTLAPLSLPGSTSLLARLVPTGLDDAENERIWGACAGTPLLLELVARSMASGGSPVLAKAIMAALPPGGEDGPPAGPPGSGVAGSLLLQRFVGLGADTFAYVRAASIFGVRFSPALAGALAGLADAEAGAAHVRLVRAGLLEDLGHARGAFVHPLFAQALLDSQTVSERERLHGEAFRLLVADGAPDALATEHAVAAGLVGDRLAVEVAARAGRAALGQGALQSAGALLANAVELAGDAPDSELLLDYASALAARARVEEAERVCDRLLGRSDLHPALRARALSVLAQAEILVSRPAQAERRYEEAAAAAALAGPEVEAATLAQAAITCQVSSPVSWVIDTASSALALLSPQQPQHNRMCSLKAYAALLGGDPSGAALLSTEIRRFVARAPGSEGGWGWTMAVHSLNTCKLLEDLPRATELFEREFARAVDEGAPILMNALAIAYADAVHRLGRPREALELVRRAIALSDLKMAPWSELAQAVLLSDLGEDAEAQAQLEALRSFRAGVPAQYHAPVSLWLDLLESRRLLAAGEPDEASRMALDAAHVARLTGWREPCIVPWAGVGIEAHIAAGRLDRARALIGELEQLSQPLPCRWPRAVLELGRARLAASTGAGEEADRRFARALSLFAELPMPIARAEALIGHGAHLRHSGRPRQAREPLASALAIAEQCEAQRVVRLARAELAACGGRRRRRNDDPRALTAQEQRVSELAASGMTNAQIGAALHLSPKTVGHHLQHVYAKLGIGSRRELIRRAPQQRP